MYSLPWITEASVGPTLNTRTAGFLHGRSQEVPLRISSVGRIVIGGSKEGADSSPRLDLRGYRYRR